MKYMGSKRSMLENGLGELICERAKHAHRVVDLFCGGGSVAWFAAENIDRPVLAVDLQTYSVILARAIIARDTPLDSDKLDIRWLAEVEHNRVKSQLWDCAISIEENAQDMTKMVQEARKLCQETSKVGPIWNAYGGYYFSPSQALTFDHMLKYLPKNEPDRSVCLATIISTASKCVASPGHTAQPFQPTDTAKAFLLEAWKRDPVIVCKKALGEICPRHAKKIGEAFVSDAFDILPNLRSDDLVIVDPPYSGVQYSRFYHVLETIAHGNCGPVEGVGRYPSITERPQSDFSKKGKSKLALESLFKALALSGTSVILTFPAGECSNGLSGQFVIDTAQIWFDADEKLINGRFSTLGGNNTYRVARKLSSELLLFLRPKN